jgi:GDPmannose 4,6-dehydratase
MKLKKAIIFGATGQDGSHLAEFLLDRDYEVVGVARRCSVDTAERLEKAMRNPRFRLAGGDITDAHSVMNLLRENADVDEIYNLAAQSHVSVSFKQPALTWDITGKGCLNILQSIVDLGLKCRFYQASSSEMFGASYNTDGHGEKFQDEETKFLPQSPYAIAKAAAHYMTRLFREAYGLHANAGILFNHEGERRGETFVTRKITKWIGDYHRWCKSIGITIFNENIRDCNITDSLIYGDHSFPKLRLGNLDAFRDWGYAGDYVEAMWLMLQQETPDDYVICTGETHTIREFLDVAFLRLDGWDKYVVIDPEFYRPAEVDYLRGRNWKAINKLGWKPKHSFKDLVELMVEHDINEDI